MGYFLPKPWLSRPLAEGPGSETPALFVSAVRYLYLLLLSFVLYYRPGSECLSHPLPLSCFNFHLHCFSLFLTTLCYGDSTWIVLLFSPRVVCQTLSFLNVWPPSLDVGHSLSLSSFNGWIPKASSHSFKSSSISSWACCRSRSSPCCRYCWGYNETANKSAPMVSQSLYHEHHRRTTCLYAL